MTKGDNVSPGVLVIFHTIFVKILCDVNPEATQHILNSVWVMITRKEEPCIEGGSSTNLFTHATTNFGQCGNIGTKDWGTLLFLNLNVVDCGSFLWFDILTHVASLKPFGYLWKSDSMTSSNGSITAMGSQVCIFDLGLVLGYSSFRAIEWDVYEISPYTSTHILPWKGLEVLSSTSIYLQISFLTLLEDFGAWDTKQKYWMHF